MTSRTLARALPPLGLACLLVVLVVSGFARIAVREPSGRDRAQRWLWSRQHDDGSFRSKDYAVLRAGRSTTAAVLRALALAVDRPTADQLRNIERGFAFLDGERFDAAPVDYPVWTAALTLQALGAWNRLDRDRELVERAEAFLRSVQLVESNGWNADRPEHGGFGLGDGPPRAPNGSDLLSIAMTSAAVEGLLAAGVPANDPMLVAARDFVIRCQDVCGDLATCGGFAFTTAPAYARSKAGEDAAGRPRPIGTSTADGLRALELLGDPRDEARCAAARRWLTDRFRADRVPGFGPARGHLEAALRVYWIEAASRVSRSSAARHALQHALAAMQRADGRVVGASAAMKEDDPLVATALAVTAWARLEAE